ncbi:Asp-tRNA(Asn)/Glu-tRNA(Gln) amidotransferase GatCAB subunit B [Candidatus Woesearchaeota archaeon CG08_land_8_20_14_0_20_47_9]|nr:MAG: hypothetical protein AUJ69_01075 [Candidatus Woesearchaeota archaeon CG1_02_47_18]PIO03787.1 MAG: Asp-tRNA(Asn)/Glu-tRNA(Gln) amidotransferase GatCAB subunit B [Candidatus Woesearchaeota archaeon CG08_land_8_20_14_0_20_47_9]HII30294.1 Asp-tRNA(Asn)/Glu-tRNA(Gln) amidotransferase subunit GatB [Candidatus Woesearchaeota archaeon]
MTTEIKCGLEIHGYIKTPANVKLFCNCLAHSSEAPNTNICPVCTGQPGCKPMPANEEAIRAVCSIALMLGCRINHSLIFQRKHYDWPDMPTGYQRTMSGSFSAPVGENGSFLGIGIREVHLEEDPARWDPKTGAVDYNRSGCPLVEIVTEPDFKSASELREWLKRLVRTLSYIKAIDEEAGIKSDVNISIAPRFSRVEIKNVNSFTSIVQAAEYEISRQEQEVRAGRHVEQSTMRWNDDKARTEFMRSKETAQDYMFIPDPDLPVISIGDAYIKDLEAGLPEKPDQKASRYRKLGVDKADADVLSSEIELASLFEVIAEQVNPVLAARWLRRELLRVLNYNKKELAAIKLEEKQIIALLEMVEKHEITDAVAKRILEMLIEKPFDVRGYVKEQRLAAISDDDTLRRLCKEAIQENPQAVADFKGGNEKALNFIVGSVMKKTKGKARPDAVKRMISLELNSLEP